MCTGPRRSLVQRSTAHPWPPLMTPPLPPSSPREKYFPGPRPHVGPIARRRQPAHRGDLRRVVRGGAGLVVADVTVAPPSPCPARWKNPAASWRSVGRGAEPPSLPPTVPVFATTKMGGGVQDHRRRLLAGWRRQLRTDDAETADRSCEVQPRCSHGRPASPDRLRRGPSKR